MLRWPMAAKEPSVIEAMEMARIICCQSVATSGKASIRTRISIATAAIFGAEAKKAVTGVGAPS